MVEAKDTQNLRENMNENSVLSRIDRLGARATELVYKGLADELEPGEIVLAYADRELSRRPPLDAMGYERSGLQKQTDAMEYAHEVGKPEADVMAYDTEAGRAQPDVMGYEKGGPTNQTDAFAYTHAEQNSETDAFISDGVGPRSADADLLLLTDRRLIRGILRGGSLELRKVPCSEGGVCVNEDVESIWLEIDLPLELRDEDEDEIWCWEVPEGGNADASAERWGGGR